MLLHGYAGRLQVWLAGGQRGRLPDPRGQQDHRGLGIIAVTLNWFDLARSPVLLLVLTCFVAGARACG